VETIPGNPTTFFSCSVDGKVRLFDLRLAKDPESEVNYFSKA